MSTLVSNISSIKEFVNEHKGGTFGVYAVTIKMADFQKPKSCPYTDRVMKVTFIQNAILGISYENSINRAEQKSGVEVGTFEKQGLPWGVWSDYPYIIEHQKTEYLRLFNGAKTNFVSVYFLDGKELSKESEEYTKMEVWLKPSSDSKKQINAGIDSEYQVRPLNYKFESICLLMQKDRLYFKGGEIEIDSQWVKDKFKKINNI